MTVSVWIIAGAFGKDSTGTDFLSLAPLVFVPLARAIAIQPTAVLQHQESWRRVSAYRITGAVMGATIGLPIVLATRSIVGASTAWMTSEITYTLIICMSLALKKKSAGRQSVLTPSDDGGGRTIGYWSTYVHMALYSTLGWLQGQSERVLLGMWAGTSALGAYSLGTAIGRSAGDAIALSQPVVLRVDLSRSEPTSDCEIKRILGRNIRGGLLLTVASAIAVIIISVYLLPPLLGPSWSTALRMGPILALSAIPLAISASSAPVHIQMGKARIAYIAPAISLLFAPVVAVGAINSLTLAAWIVLLRECVLALMQSVLMRRAAPWREVSLALVIVALGSLAVIAIEP